MYKGGLLIRSVRLLNRFLTSRNRFPGFGPGCLRFGVQFECLFLIDDLFYNRLRGCRTILDFASWTGPGPRVNFGLLSSRHLLLLKLICPLIRNFKSLSGSKTAEISTPFSIRSVSIELPYNLGNAHLPSKDLCPLDFLQDLTEGKKKYVIREKAGHRCPTWPELSIKRLWPDVQ